MTMFVMPDSPLFTLEEQPIQGIERSH